MKIINASTINEAYAEAQSIKHFLFKYSLQPNQLGQWKYHIHNNGGRDIETDLSILSILFTEVAKCRIKYKN
jgi:hypothetical protein